MSIPIPLFQPLDLPQDISMILNDLNYYIFCKDDNHNQKIYFTVELDTTKNQMVSYQVENYKKTTALLFETIQFYGTNLNDYLWRISNSGYNHRFLKLEIIERIRILNDVSQMQKLICFLKENMSSNNYPEDV